MSIAPGSRIGSYEIVAEIGAGGMGQVWRAHDSKLNRDVAVKVLPPRLSGDAQYMARFEREAQLLASLNHPNIATLYGLEDSGPALVMELVEGPTLLERIQRGALPVPEALAIARQICHALEAAHAKGIIHRDLKPANIKLTSDGQVKVLDFGLAKALESESAAPITADSPTMTMQATRAGVILGTAAYMSPEQARGLPADKRADIWAFGLVLYEMLTGRVTFGGETVADTMASVLKTDPDFSRLPAETPSSIRRLLKRCLQRDRRNRLHDIADARLELDAASEEPASAAAGTRIAWLPWALAGVLALSTFAAAILLWRDEPAPASRFELLPPEGDVFGQTGHQVSPDGRLLLVRTARQGNLGDYRTSLRPLNSASYRELPEANGAVQLQFSPDSRSIVFADGDRARRLDFDTGSATSLCPVDSSLRGFAWSAKGTVLFGSNAGPVQRVAATGGTPTPVTKLAPTERGHGFPTFLPEGRFFLYTSFSSKGDQVVVADMEGRDPPKMLFPLKGGAAFFAANADLRTGIVLYRDGNSLLGISFDVTRREVMSGPYPVLENLGVGFAGALPASISVPARVLLWKGTNASNDGTGLDLVLLDGSGKLVRTLSGTTEYAWGHPEFSLDGTRLLGDRRTGDVGRPLIPRDLWALDLQRNVPTRLTFDGAPKGGAVYSPDGMRIYYYVDGPGHGIFSVAADGSGAPIAVLTGRSVHHMALTPDGRHIAFEAGVAGIAREILIVPADGRGKPEVLIGGPFDKAWPQFSPNGNWIAYASNESGPRQIYVQSYPLGSGKWQVTRDGGQMARWRGDGRELVVHQGGGKFVSVEVRERVGKIEFGAPKPLFEAAMGPQPTTQYFAMTRDGQKFALTLPPAGKNAAPRPQTLTVDLDWMPALKR